MPQPDTANFPRTRPEHEGALELKDIVIGAHIEVRFPHRVERARVLSKPFTGGDEVSSFVAVALWDPAKGRFSAKPELLDLAEAGVTPYRNRGALCWDPSTYTVAVR